MFDAWSAIENDILTEKKEVEVGSWKTSLKGEKRHPFLYGLPNTGKTEVLKILEASGHKMGHMCIYRGLMALGTEEDALKEYFFMMLLS